MKIPRAGYGLLAALLFGVSTPVAKELLDGIDPMMLAGLLYLGSGVGLVISVAVIGVGKFKELKLTDVNRNERLFFFGAVVFGGMIAPVLLMMGLRSVDGSSASLLLNLEGALTALLACVVFHEHYGQRLVIGLTFILAGGALLASGERSSFHGHWSGILMIGGACACWALDNNFTNQVRSIDAPVLAAIKGLASGMVNIGLALILGQRLPTFAKATAAGGLGFVGYGLSLVCFILSLRKIGAARTSAYFSTAPFVGAAVSLGLLREPIQWQLIAAGVLMAVGVYLHLTERASPTENEPTPA